MPKTNDDYISNIQGAIQAFKDAGSPDDAKSDLQNVIQQNYNKVAPTGYFSHGEGQQLGHILRGNWGVADSGQGLVTPAAPSGPDQAEATRIGQPLATYKTNIARNRAAMAQGNAAPTMSGNITGSDVLQAVKGAPKVLADTASGAVKSTVQGINSAAFPITNAYNNFDDAAERALANAPAGLAKHIPAGKLRDTLNQMSVRGHQAATQNANLRHSHDSEITDPGAAAMGLVRGVLPIPASADAYLERGQSPADFYADPRNAPAAVGDAMLLGGGLLHGLGSRIGTKPPVAAPVAEGHGLIPQVTNATANIRATVNRLKQTAPEPPSAAPVAAHEPIPVTTPTHTTQSLAEALGAAHPDMAHPAVVASNKAILDSVANNWAHIHQRPAAEFADAVIHAIQPGEDIHAPGVISAAMDKAMEPPPTVPPIQPIEAAPHEAAISLPAESVAQATPNLGNAADAPKPAFHDMTPDEVATYHDRALNSDKNDTLRAFGGDQSKVDEYENLYRASNSSNPMTADAAAPKLQAIEDALTPHQQSILYGNSPEYIGYSADETKSYLDTPTSADDVPDASSNLAYGILKLPDPTKPIENMSAKEKLGLYQVRNTLLEAKKNGLDTKEVSKAAFDKLRGTFKQRPEDFNFMTEGYRDAFGLTDDKPNVPKLAAPAAPKSQLDTSAVNPGDWVQSKVDPSQFGRVVSVGEVGKTPAYEITMDGGKTTSKIVGDVKHTTIDALPAEIKADQPHDLDTLYQEGPYPGKSNPDGTFNINRNLPKNQEPSLTPGEIFDRGIADANDKVIGAHFALPNDLADRITESTGVDVHGYASTVSADAARHVFEEHNVNTQHGELPVTKSDFEKIPDIVQNFDSVVYRGGNRAGERDVLEFSKRYNGHTYYLTETLTGRKLLVSKTMYKRKSGPVPGAAKGEPDSAPGWNVQNDPGHSNSSIPPPTDAVKPSDTLFQRKPETRYRKVKAGETVSGLVVREHIPNMSSIEPSHEALSGIREVPVSDFKNDGYASADDTAKVNALADQIKRSGEINPLIVAIDKNGPYIVEGGHRLGALKQLGVKSIPAKVVIDRDSIPDLADSSKRFNVTKDDNAKPYRLHRNTSPDIISRHATADAAWNEADRLNTGDILRQNVKGSVTFRPEDGKAVIKMFRSANISTAIHEIGHVARRHALSKEQLAVFEKHYGVKDGNWAQLDEHGVQFHEEQFARDFENYLASGKAPKPSLQEHFDNLKKWLTQVYANVKGSPLESELHPDLKAEFDKFFSRDEPTEANTASEKSGASSLTGDSVEKPLSKTAQEKTDKYAGSINVRLMGNDPEAIAEVRETAKRLGLDNKPNATDEQARELGKSLGLSYADMEAMQVGKTPNAPDNIDASVWQKAYGDAVRNLHAQSKHELIDAKRATVEASDEYADAPTPANQKALDAANVRQAEAHRISDLMQAHDDKLANLAGVALQGRSMTSLPTKGEGYMKSLAAAPSLKDTLGWKTTPGRSNRPARVRTVTREDADAAIQRLKSRGNLVLKQQELPKDSDTLYQHAEPDDATKDLVELGKFHFEGGDRDFTSWRAQMEKSLGQKLPFTDSQYVYRLTKSDLAADVKAKQAAALKPLFVDTLGRELGSKGSAQFLIDLPQTIREKLIDGTPASGYTDAEKAAIKQAWDENTPARLKPATPHSQTVAKQIAEEGKASASKPNAAVDFDGIVARRVKGGAASAKAIRADLESDAMGKAAIEKVTGGESLSKDEGRRLARAIDKYKRLKPVTDPNELTQRITKVVSDARRGWLGYDSPREMAAEVLARQLPSVTDADKAALAKAQEELKGIESDDIPALEKFLHKHTPVDSVSKSAIDWIKSNMLASVSLTPIVGKIPLSHIVYNGLEDLKDYPAALADMIRANVTGSNHTVSIPNPIRNARVLWDAAQRIKTDIPVAFTKGDIGLKLRGMDIGEEGSELHTNSKTILNKIPGVGPYVGKLVDYHVNQTGRWHGTYAQINKIYAFSKSLDSQANLLAKNEQRDGASYKERYEHYRNNPTEQMIQNATASAIEQVFLNKNVISDFISKGKQTPWIGKAIDLEVPFPKVPSNIALRALEYGPGGIIKSFGGNLLDYDRVKAERAGTSPKYEFKKAFSKDVMTDEQARRWAHSFGRGIVGSGVMALATYMYFNGNAVPANHEAFTPAMIRVGNKWYPVSDKAPIGATMSMGFLLAALSQAKKDGDKKKINEYENQIIPTLVSEAPGVGENSGFSEIFKPQYYSSMAKNAIAPGYVQSITGAIDPVKRKIANEFSPKMLEDTAKSVTPGLSKQLPPNGPRDYNPLNPFRPRNHVEQRNINKQKGAGLQNL